MHQPGLLSDVLAETCPRSQRAGIFGAAVNLNRDAPEASSAPPHVALRQALLSTLSQEQRMALESGSAPSINVGPLPPRAAAEQVGEVLSAGESSAHLGSREWAAPTTAVPDGPAAEEMEGRG